MWPWEHAAFGYVVYSLTLRALGHEPPDGVTFGAVLCGTQLPDLVDKPLSWAVGVFPTGHAAGHSLFVAIPVGALILGLGWRRGAHTAAGGFIVGYFSHLLGDVVHPLRVGDPPRVERVLWPLSNPSGYDQDIGIARGIVYLGDFAAGLGSTDPLWLLVFYVLAPASAVVLWVLDGMPGSGLPGRILATIRR